MKRKYEKNELIVFFSILFFILIIIVCLFLWYKKISIYKTFSGIVYKDNVLEVVVSVDDLKLFYKNEVIYIEDKSYKLDILKVDENILKRGGKKYSSVFINVKFTDMYKLNDVITFSIREKGMRLIEIFKIIWEE